MTMQPTTEGDLIQALQACIPSIKTQAQLNAFTAAFDALRYALDGIFTQSAEREASGKYALEKAFDIAHKSTEILASLKEVPEEQRGPATRAFTDPPTNTKEYDLQRGLLQELEAITDLDALSLWYTDCKDRRDAITSQPLRDTLMDAIRAKRRVLGPSNNTST